jgi:hypothetical protein
MFCHELVGVWVVKRYFDYFCSNLDDEVDDGEDQHKRLNTLSPCLIEFVALPECTPVDEPDKIEDPCEYEKVNQSGLLI